MMNPLNLVRIMRNPQGFFNALSQNQQAMQNPMLKNAVDMVQKQDGKGLEQMARNLYKNAGIDIDEKMREIKSQMGLN